MVIISTIMWIMGYLVPKRADDFSGTLENCAELFIVLWEWRIIIWDGVGIVCMVSYVAMEHFCIVKIQLLSDQLHQVCYSYCKQTAQEVIC